VNYERLTINELTERAEQLEDAGELDDALDFWRAAIQRESDPVVLCQFGSLARRLKKWSEAESALMRAMNVAPELPYPCTLLGTLYFDQDMLEEAREYFQKSVTIEKSAPTLTQLGVVQLELDLTEDARASLQEAIKIDPNYEEAYYNLGSTYREDQPSKAVELFEKAAELDPEYALAQRELGWALSRREEKDAEAEYHIRRAVELNDEDAWAHIYLGNILWQRGDLSSAEQSFKNAVEVWPDIAVPYWCLALFHEHQGRKEEAERLYQQGLDLDPYDPQSNKLFGMHLKEIGEPAKARTYLERAQTLDPEDQSISEALDKLN